MPVGSLRVIRSVAPVVVAVAMVTGVAALHAARDRAPSGTFLEALPVGAAHPEGPRIALIFQGADCSRIGPRLRRWNALPDSSATEHLPVEGYLLDGSAEDVETIGRTMELDFPLRSVESRRVAPRLRALGFRRTPILLAFDAEGRLRLAAPLASAPEPPELAALLTSSDIPDGGER